MQPAATTRTRVPRPTQQSRGTVRRKSQNRLEEQPPSHTDVGGEDEPTAELARELHPAAAASWNQAPQSIGPGHKSALWEGSGGATGSPDAGLRMRRGEQGQLQQERRAPVSMLGWSRLWLQSPACRLRDSRRRLQHAGHDTGRRRTVPSTSLPALYAASAGGGAWKSGRRLPRAKGEDARAKPAPDCRRDGGRRQRGLRIWAQKVQRRPETGDQGGGAARAPVATMVPYFLILW